MATAFPHADRTASEARRPEAGSRAVGVSRAERGNDGSPSGARRRRRLDALRARERDRPCFLAGDALTSRLDAQAHAPVIGKQVRQRLLWSGRSGAAGSAVFEGRQASRGGDSPRAFPWRQAKRAVPRKGRAGITPSRQGAGWIPIPASTAMTSPAGSAHRARTDPTARWAGRTR